ncbi:MAG: hypothetical protein HN975_16380 [Anaerolineae bacterium]|jgi:DNA-binding SARP family transcriptional activator/predicted ATPase|nr:hypothetical protein [Anaerolineae bacterium]MBT7989333.1 hypothetical protein [Anaerolineae bacterium]
MKPSNLTISLLGGLRITQNGVAVSGFASRKVEALLVYLVCNPRPHPRETLATLFWPEHNQTRALANLSVALTSLRKQLKSYLTAERHTVVFDTDVDFELDTVIFKKSITQAREDQQRRGKLGRESAAQLATAVTLYEGDFLAGFYIRGATEFEAWMMLEQERLRQILLDALSNLITFHQQREQFEEGIRYARQLLAVDPLQESVHRQLMILYTLDNQRTAALAQYEQCVQILEAELGIQPDEETTALYEQIKTDRGVTSTWERVPRLSLSPQHNLPAPTTKFIDREKELAQIDHWLVQPDGRLLTILGSGGMGKTRLAQESARTHLGEFADGAWFVSLVPHTDLGGVVTAIAEATNFTFSGRVKPITQLLTYLKAKEMLLVLDNMEHLITPPLLTLIIQLTEQAPDLRLIATSRTRLNLHTETILELQGLPYLETSEQNPVDGLNTTNRILITESPAAQLFTNRVQRIQAGFSPEEQETDVAQLCQLVGGLPLALELAATWTRILSVAEIVIEIRRGLDTLTTTLHDLPQRHRSIHTVIETSWQMLSSDEQTLLRKLSIFRNGFTREAAQEVTNATLPQLMSLVDHSFLRLDADQRFRRHPLLLKFAQEQLAAHPEEQTQVEVDHAHFFSAFVQTYEHALLTSDAPEAIKAIGADLENSRTAWKWALEHNNLNLVHQIVPAWYIYFINTTQVTLGFALFEAGVDKFADIAINNEKIIWLHCAFGCFASLTSDTETAAKTLVKCVDAARQLQKKYLTAFALSRLGVNSEHQGKKKESQHYLKEALQLAEELDNPYFLTSSLLSLAIIEWEIGELNSAEQRTTRSMKLADEFNYKIFASESRYWLGQFAYSKKDYQRAINHLEESHQMARIINNGQGNSVGVHLLGATWGALGDHQRALVMKRQAIQMEADTGDVWHKAIYKFSIANTLIELGRFGDAENEARHGVQLTGAGMPLPTLSNLATLGRVAAQRGKLAEAVSLLTFSLSHPAMADLLAIGFQDILDGLQAEMRPSVFEDAQKRAAEWTLDGVVRQTTR